MMGARALISLQADAPLRPAVPVGEVRSDSSHGFQERAPRRRNASSILDSEERRVRGFPVVSSRRDSSNNRCGISCRNAGR
jgi:hypothetical protein